jgi:2-octaprenyl-6-methoxyphenol hydroxylase
MLYGKYMLNVFDTAIIGGGLNGLAAACFLAHYDIKTALIEKNPLSAGKIDRRTSALNYGSKIILERIGLWQKLEKYCEPINDIHILNNNRSAFLHFNHKAVGGESMGYIIENQYLKKVFSEVVKKSKNIELIVPGEYDKIQQEDGEVKISIKGQGEIRAKLLIASDGKFSKLRERFGIKNHQYNYEQAALIVNIKHKNHHENTAVENFLPNGPFALLPMKGGYETSIVWTEKAKLAPYFSKMNEEDLKAELKKRFADYFEEIEISSPLQRYPLTLTFSTRYIDKRVAFIGDAIHSIHPITGQGFNLGLQDTELLGDLIVEQKNLGLDIGGYTILAEYDAKRKLRNGAMIAITHSFNKLFSNNILPIDLLRSCGLEAVEKISPLKNFFIKYAMAKHS